MVAYGPMYLDESLTQCVTGAYEIMHLVLLRNYDQDPMLEYRVPRGA